MIQYKFHFKPEFKPGQYIEHLMIGKASGAQVEITYHQKWFVFVQQLFGKPLCQRPVRLAAVEGNHRHCRHVYPNDLQVRFGYINCL